MIDKPLTTEERHAMIRDFEIEAEMKTRSRDEYMRRVPNGDADSFNEGWACSRMFTRAHRGAKEQLLSAHLQSRVEAMEKVIDLAWKLMRAQYFPVTADDVRARDALADALIELELKSKRQEQAK